MLKRKPSHKRLQPRGKSNKSRERESWQREMIATYGYHQPCAICGSREGSYNAHRLKKRFIRTKEEYVHGRVHLCMTHHRNLDEATYENPHEIMFLTISNLMEIEVESPEATEMWERLERMGMI